MLILVLGKGKTGSLVAEVARERGHGVRALDINENEHASALTAPNLAGVDVVIDFTAPEAAVENIRAVLALGGRIVVGTTGWYAHLDEMKALAHQARRSASLRHQLLHRRAKTLPPHRRARPARGLQLLHRRNPPHLQARRPFRHRPHLEGDHPLRAARRKIAVTSHRIGDAKGEHIVTASSDYDTLELRHDATSRRGFALGAVRGAEWLAGKSGAWEFRESFGEM